MKEQELPKIKINGTGSFRMPTPEELALKEQKREALKTLENQSIIILNGQIISDS